MDRPRHRDRRWLAPLRLLLALAPAWLGPPARAQDTLALAVKATYLYKLAPFVTWPASGGPSSPFVLCVVGDDPFGPLLDRAVAGQKVSDRLIEVRRLRVASPHSGCQIAYVGGSSQQSVADALRLLRGDPVLTVTDDRGGAAVIDFLVDQGHVRFRINEQAAAENGLSISSKLLSLAVSVTPRRTPSTQ